MRISDWSSDVCSSDLEARERVDQADVRTFRGFNRADAAIMGGVNVAHFKARAFTGKTARPERRHTTLVRDFGQRIGLIHRSEEHTSELQSLMRISYAVFCLKKKKTT